MEGYLLTKDIEIAFDSVDHYFSPAILEKYGFKKKFLRLIETLLHNQKTCIINGGITTHYFQLKNWTRQGNPVSVYLFILVLEVVFCLIKSNKNFKGLNIFNHEFFYTAYVDNTTLFLKDKISVFETLDIFHKFSLVSGLSLDTTKCEIVGTGK